MKLDESLRHVTCKSLPRVLGDDSYFNFTNRLCFYAIWDPGELVLFLVWSREHAGKCRDRQVLPDRPLLVVKLDYKC